MMRVAGEDDIVAAVRPDDAWALVEEFSGIVRDSGTPEERKAASLILARLERWGVPHRLHEPEVLISLPGRAALTVGGTSYRVKTPSMARSTSPSGETAPIVYEPGRFATDVNDIFAGTRGGGEVAGRFVVTEGFPMPGTVTDLAARGALGVVCISPGERIHEGICTPIWGSPDLTSYARKPRIPVLSISNPDGKRLVEQIGDGSPDATIVAQHDEDWVSIPVIVAEIEGRTEPERFVLLHGHLDSWHVGVGDNATGDATLLEAARVLHEHGDKLERSVRIAWWSGHSHGRYAGSTWYADTFAHDLERNCICHINCDSPGCVDAEVFEDVYWMAEVESFGREAIHDFAGASSASGRPPMRAGDISFNNLGVSTFFMLSSTMPQELRERKGYYPVGGCGGNIEWHTEADTIEVADRTLLVRDMKLYTGAAFRAANAPVHPLDLRATIEQLRGVLDAYAAEFDKYVSLRNALEIVEQTGSALEHFYARASEIDSVERARPVNDALLKMGRTLVPVLYCSEGHYRQDPALDFPLLPDFARARDAIGSVPDGVVRTEITRASNRLIGALVDVQDAAARTK